MGFKIGEKIVCIKPTDNLKINNIYTINFIYEDSCRLVELDFEPFLEGYLLWRFRKVDYKFAENLLSNIKEEVQHETNSN